MLDELVKVASAGAGRPLGDCTVQDLERACRVAEQDMRGMVRRDVPARVYSARSCQAALYAALRDELRHVRVPWVRLLSPAARERATTRAEV